MTAGAAEAGAAPRGSPELGQALRMHRLQRRLSLRSLAKAARCSPSFLSMIEQGGISPTVRSLQSICDALGTTVSDLLRPAAFAPDPVVVRRAESKGRVIMRWDKAISRLLLPPEANCQFTLMLTTVKPGGQTSFRVSPVPLSEVHMVMKGRPTFVVDGANIEVRPGDYVYFDLTRRHKIVNKTRSTVEVLAINASRFHLIEDLEGNRFPVEG